MSSLNTRTVRIPVDLDKAGAPKSPDGRPVELFAGTDIRLRFAFFRSGRLVTDFSSAEELTVQVKDLGAEDTPPADTDPYWVSSATDAFDGTLTLAQWNADTGCHAEVFLDGDLLSFRGGVKWLVVVATIDGRKRPVAAGPVRFLDDGFGAGASQPPPVQPYPPAEDVATKDYVADIADAEASARSDADAGLLAAIAAEKTARENADAALDAAKVDKVAGKGLSTEDYTSAEKAKLAATTGTNTGDQDLSGFVHRYYIPCVGDYSSGHVASGAASVVGGGDTNMATGNYAVVGGGLLNGASGFVGVVAGGCFNTASGDYAAIGGGAGNTASGYRCSTVAGGNGNTASGYGATVGGGVGNLASADRATVAGGFLCSATAPYASVLGGCDMRAGRPYRQEVGARQSASIRVRTSWQAPGLVIHSLRQSDAPPTASAATWGDEDDNAMFPLSYAAQLNAAGDALKIFVNVGGVIKSASLALL